MSAYATFMVGVDFYRLQRKEGAILVNLIVQDDCIQLPPLHQDVTRPDSERTQRELKGTSVQDVA